MINTYHTSLAAPPVPPRLSRSQPVLIPAPLPSRVHSKSLVRFLVGVVLLHLILSVGAFIYVYDKMGKRPSAEGEASFHSSERQETSHRALARMVVKQQSHTEQKPALGYLQWDINHSVHRNINYYRNSWLTIMEPGDYYVYSRVTFSKGDSQLPLASIVKLRKSEKEEAEGVMQAYCSLEGHSGSPSVPRLCTVTQGGLITLEKGNQLSVWVQDLSLVNYEEGATAFGMYQL